MPAATRPVEDPAQATGRTPDDLVRILGELMDGRLSSLVLTTNRSRFLSCRPSRGGGFALRLHRCFLTAGPAILKAAARFAMGALEGEPRRHALALLRRHFDQHREPLPADRGPRRRSRVRLEPRGRVLDLRCLRDELNERFFGGRVGARITWGRALPRRSSKPATRRTLRLGSYDSEKRLIRVHRVLDHPEIPREVVEAVVYHEMLHADLPPVVVRGRRYVHTPEFRRRERLLPAYGEAESWLETHLPKLLAARFHRC